MLKVTSILLKDLSAEVLLRETKAACFAVGADPAGWTVKVLCQRVVEVMVKGQASEASWCVARVVATAAGRYMEFCDAMEQARIKPPLTHDLVRYGIDVGYRRGRRRGVQRGLEQGLEQGLRRALLATYGARFGAPPAALCAAVEAMRDPETLLAWQAVFTTRTARAIAATVMGDRVARRRG